MKRLGSNTSSEQGTHWPWPIAAVLCAVQFVDVLGVTVVITALPSMLDELGATSGQGTLVVTVYAACFGGLLMLAARVGERVGHRRLVTLAMVLFAAASLLGALAPSATALTIARALQGAAAAASVPSALRLLTTLVPEGAARRRAVAGWSAAGAAAGASGFVIGGGLSELASWRAVFWMNILIVAVLIPLVLRVVPPDSRRSRDVGIPWVSAGLLTAAAMSLVGGPTVFAEGGSSPLGIAVVAFGLAIGLGFWTHDRRTRAPLLPEAARLSTNLRWGAFGSFVNTATTSSTITVATLYLQQERGLTPLQAGATLVSFSLLVVAGSTAASRLIGAVGWRRSLGLGLGVVAAGNATMAVWPGTVGIAIAAGMCGAGLGIGSVAATDMGTHVEESVKATAAGAINTAAQLGTAVGTAIILLIATASGPHSAWLTVTVCAAFAAMTAASKPDSVVS